MSYSHKVDVIIDEKKITSKGHKIELKIDGVKVFSTGDLHSKNKVNIEDLQWTSIKNLIEASDSAFSHVDRFRIIKSLAESPKSFTQIKDLLNTTSATTNFHLKKLNSGMIIYKNENRRYALTLLGELIIDYFSRFLEEANLLEDSIKE